MTSYDIPGYSGNDWVVDRQVDPSGQRMFVLIQSYDSDANDLAWVTASYDVVTGTELWHDRLLTETKNGGGATALAMNPDGSSVYVTGFRNVPDQGTCCFPDYLTVGYDAASGERLWRSEYSGPAGDKDLSPTLAVSPDGLRVYVAGTSEGRGTEADFAIVAYDASTGDEKWVGRYDGPASGPDVVFDVIVGPASDKVFVTGTSKTTRGWNDFDFLTVAYDTTTGSQLWDTSYSGPGEELDYARAIALSPDGSSIYVTGGSTDKEATDQFTDYGDYATVAYDAATGDQRWAARYEGTLGSSPRAIAAGAERVYVTGLSMSNPSQLIYDWDQATVAYDADDGSQSWARRSGRHPGVDGGFGMTLSPDQRSLFVTGYSQSPQGVDVLTTSYQAVDGAQGWQARYNAAPDGTDARGGWEVFLIPSGKVLVAADSYGYSSSLGLTYDPRPGPFPDLGSPPNPGPPPGPGPLPDPLPDPPDRPRTPSSCAPETDDDMCEAWVSTYDNPDGHGGRNAGNGDDGRGMDISPDGKKIFVTGWSHDASRDVTDLVTTAFDTRGNPLWATRHPAGKPTTLAWGNAVVAGPEGERVYATGVQNYAGGSGDFATVAYDSTTGEELWSAGYDGPGAGTFFDRDQATHIATSPDGMRVYVAGASGSDDTEWDQVVVAYDALTGEQLWVARYDARGKDDFLYSMAVSPSADHVYVTGRNALGADDDAMTTVAFDTTDGKTAWAATQEGRGSGQDVIVSPDGSQVYVTGGSANEDGGSFIIAAYDATDGRELWEARPLAGKCSLGLHLSASPDGSKIYATGLGDGNCYSEDVTVAVDAVEGQTLWVSPAAITMGNSYGWAMDLEVSPDGNNVYVAGFSDSTPFLQDPEFATVSYRAADGGRAWTARYKSGPADGDFPFAGVEVSPDGAHVYSAGTFLYNPASSANYSDIGVLAYDTGAVAGPEPTPTPTPSTSPSTSPGPGRGTASTTLTTSRSRTPYRKPFELSGKVTLDEGCGDPTYYTISLAKRVHGTTRSRTVASAIPVASDGSWAHRRRSKRSASYVATVSSTRVCDGTRSSPRDVATRAKVKVELAGSCGRRGHRIMGRVFPRHRGTRVLLQRRRPEGWKVVDRDVLNRYSRFRLRAPRCKGRYRVLWRSQAKDNLRGWRAFKL